MHILLGTITKFMSIYETWNILLTLSFCFMLYLYWIETNNCNVKFNCFAEPHASIKNFSALNKENNIRSDLLYNSLLDNIISYLSNFSNLDGKSCRRKIQWTSSWLRAASPAHLSHTHTHTKKAKYCEEHSISICFLIYYL